MYSREEKKQLIHNFWNMFDKYCNKFPELKSRNKKWILYNTGISRIDLKFEVEREDVKVILEVNHRNELRRLQVYEKLEKYKLMLEEGFSDGLIWNLSYSRSNGQEVCRIYEQLNGFDFHRQKHWPEIFEFMAVNMMKLERNFLEIKDLLTDD